MMKQFLTTLFLSILSITTYAQGLQLQWANTYKGTGKVSATGIVTDSQGNVYVAGYFEGVADLDPGSGTANLSTGIGINFRKSFLAKYDAQGNYVFAHPFNVQNIKAIVLDNTGNIYIGGAYDTIVDLNPGTGVSNITYAGGLNDGFVAKFSSNGDYINGFSISGTDAEHIDRMAVDNDNNLYVGGPFQDTIDVDPIGTATLISAFNDVDVFIAKYAPNGSLLNHFKIRNSNDLRSIVIDHNNNLWLAGSFNQTLDLDPGPNSTNNIAIEGQDGFYAKYTSGGNYIKGFTFDGYTSYIDVDNNDNLYILGATLDSMDIAPGAPVHMIYSPGIILDYYIAKMDANDNVVFANVFTGTALYNGGGIKLGAQNSFFISGYFAGTLDLTPDSTGGMLISNGNNDAFVAQFDLDGNRIFSTSFGNTLPDVCFALDLDNHGNVWLGGYFYDEIDIDFGPGITNLEAPNQGGYVAKYFDTTVGINEVDAELPIKVYGAESKVFIDFSALSKTNAQVQVLNILGQTVYQTSHNKSNKLTIELPETGGQIYFVRVANGDKAIAKKLFVE
jgi:hypothetical protein